MLYMQPCCIVEALKEGNFIGEFEIVNPLGADAELNKRGIQAVEEVLKEARRLARGLPPEKREAIEKICTEIEALMKELAELQARGEVRRRGEGREGERERERERERGKEKGKVLCIIKT